MSKTRVWGGTCHNAKRPKCRCWCGGVFHGSAGQSAREAFAREFAQPVLPTTEAAFNEVTGQMDLFTDASAGQRWKAAIAAAVAAREEASGATRRVQRDRVQGAGIAV